MTKRVKQVLCLVLAMAMFAAMGVTAMASSYVITIDPAYAGETYSVYHVFDIAASSTPTNIVYEISTSNPWYDIITNDSNAPFKLTTQTGSTTTYTVEPTTIVESDLASWFRNLDSSILNDIQTNYSSYVQTKTAPGTGGAATTLAFDVEEPGYYFITTTTGTLVTLTNLMTTQTVKDKNLVPEVDKEIVDNGTTTQSSTAAVGTTLTFQTTLQNFYEAKELELVDTMDNLKFERITSVYLDFEKTNGGTTTLIENTDYTVVSDDDGFTITFITDSTNMETALASTVLVVTYEATVTADAEYTDPATNDTYVKYGTNSTSNQSETNTYPLGFVLKKTDATSGTVLDGATFEIWTSDGTSDHNPATQLNFIAEYDTYGALVAYRLATAAEIAAPDPNLVSEVTVGEVPIKGLDEGVYVLIETAAPAGYNMLQYNIWVRLEYSSANGEEVSYRTAASTDAFKTITADSSGNFVLTVTNNQGTSIPDTGGIGTTIFYIVGAMLMIGAALVLITRRRMRNNEQ